MNEYTQSYKQYFSLRIIYLYKRDTFNYQSFNVFLGRAFIQTRYYSSGFDLIWRKKTPRIVWVLIWANLIQAFHWLVLEFENVKAGEIIFSLFSYMILYDLGFIKLWWLTDLLNKTKLSKPRYHLNFKFWTLIESRNLIWNWRIIAKGKTVKIPLFKFL